MRTDAIGWKVIDTPVTALILSHDSMTSRVRAAAKERITILLVDDNQHGLARAKRWRSKATGCHRNRGPNALEILASQKIHRSSRYRMRI